MSAQHCPQLLTGSRQGALLCHGLTMSAFGLPFLSSGQSMLLLLHSFWRMGFWCALKCVVRKRRATVRFCSVDTGHERSQHSSPPERLVTSGVASR